MSEKNIHAKAALREGISMEESLVEATLALAYEQRTATLATLFVAGFNAVQVNGVDYEDLADQIKERLGL
jgi:hypothetical protein